MRPLRAWIETLFAERRPRRLLFRVDAGRVGGLSFGHLARCLILARVCLDVFASRCLFLMRDLPEGVAAARQAGETVVTLGAAEACGDQAPVLGRECVRFRPDWVVVDLPYGGFGHDCFEGVRAAGAKTVFVDDFRFRNPGAEVYLNSSILAPERMASDPADKRPFFLGPRYFICDPPEPCPAQRTEGRVNGLLTFGGSDPTGLTAMVLDALVRRDWPRTRLRLALGPGFGPAEDVHGRLRGREDFEIHVNPPSLWPLISGCDLAVSAGGRTLYELCTRNKPVLAVATSPVEAEAVRMFKNRGLIADGLTRWDPQRFMDAFTRLWASVQGAGRHQETSA